MRKLLVPLLVLAMVQLGAAAEPCQTLYEGDHQDQITLLLVGGSDYTSQEAMLEDLRYYIDADQDNRGLLDVYPFNVTTERFHIMYAQGRNGSATTDGPRGPFREARYLSDQCGGIDHAVYLAQDDHDWVGGAIPPVARCKGIADKVDAGRGGACLIHEWGHAFGHLADEYEGTNGTADTASRPNCATSREQARDWWGRMAAITPRVGYDDGCKGHDAMVEPHPGGTIMGDGGLHHYGPINDRQLLQEIADATGPVTDTGITATSIDATAGTVSVTVHWNRASHVLNVSLQPGPSRTIFIHGSGQRTLTFDVADMPSTIRATTATGIEQADTTDDAVHLNASSTSSCEPPAGMTIVDQERWARCSQALGPGHHIVNTSTWQQQTQQIEEQQQRIQELEQRVQQLEEQLDRQNDTGSPGTGTASSISSFLSSLLG